MIGNALTPGEGFREGPFATEAELRELVDLAEAGRVIESGERKMIHSVFELGDTIVREVMVPRTDIVFIEANKTLRHFQTLALRSGFSRIPVVGAGGLDDIVGIAYLKDVARRLYDNRNAESVERIESVMRPASTCPTPSPWTTCCGRCRHSALMWRWSSTSTAAPLAVTIEDILEEIVGEITDEYDTGEATVQRLEDGAVRVQFAAERRRPRGAVRNRAFRRRRRQRRGLMAKHLGRVPIPGAEVEMGGLRLVAEGPAGRRNQIATILVTRVGAFDEPSANLTRAVAEPGLTERQERA